VFGFLVKPPGTSGAPPRLQAPALAYEVNDQARVCKALNGECIPSHGRVRAWTDQRDRRESLGGAISTWPTDHEEGAEERDPGLLFRELVLVADRGVDPCDDETDEWTVEGQSAMRLVLLEPPATSLDRFIGADEARLRAAEDVGRQYLLTAAAIEAVTGRPYVARRGLLTPGTKAAKLAEEREERRERREAKARAEAEAAARAVRAPPTVLESGCQLIACRKDRLTTTPEPFVGAMVQGETADDLIFVIPLLPGARIPAFELDGVRLVDDDSVMPPMFGEIPPPSLPALDFCRRMRRKFATHLDFERCAEWTEDGVAKATDLIRQFGRYMVDVTTRLWLAQHGMELVVRGCRLHPSRAVALVLEYADRVHASRHKPFAIGTGFSIQEQTLARADLAHFRDMGRPETGRREVLPPGAEDVPSRSPGMRAMLGDSAVSAAMGGSVGIGELLSIDDTENGGDA
jgi:hypothetical protein